MLQGYPMTYKSTSGQVITERAGNEPPSYDFFMKMKVRCGTSTADSKLTSRIRHATRHEACCMQPDSGAQGREYRAK